MLTVSVVADGTTWGREQSWLKIWTVWRLFIRGWTHGLDGLTLMLTLQEPKSSSRGFLQPIISKLSSWVYCVYITNYTLKFCLLERLLTFCMLYLHQREGMEPAKEELPRRTRAAIGIHLSGWCTACYFCRE